jgi:hypothetical protein
VPEPVMSVALTPKSTDQLQNFQKALSRFQKEDPTFHVKNDAGMYWREFELWASGYKEPVAGVRCACVQAVQLRPQRAALYCCVCAQLCFVSPHLCC